MFEDSDVIAAGALMLGLIGGALIAIAFGVLRRGRTPSVNVRRSGDGIVAETTDAMRIYFQPPATGKKS